MLVVTHVVNLELCGRGSYMYELHIHRKIVCMHVRIPIFHFMQYCHIAQELLKSRVACCLNML